jgi:hypothetical protein
MGGGGEGEGGGGEGGREGSGGEGGGDSEADEAHVKFLQLLANVVTSQALLDEKAACVSALLQSLRLVPSKMLQKFATPETSHPARLWLKTAAPSNVLHMLVVREVSHDAKGWLKLAAPMKTCAMLRTRAVSHAAKGWLKAAACWNMYATSVRLAVFHSSGWSKLLAELKVASMLATFCVSHPARGLLNTDFRNMLLKLVACAMFQLLMSSSNPLLKHARSQSANEPPGVVGSSPQNRNEKSVTAETSHVLMWP